MDDKILEVLDILSDYDNTLSHALGVFEVLCEDERIATDTLAMMEGVLVAIMVDAGERLIPDSEQEQEAIMDAATGLEEVYATLPTPSPLLYQMAIAYAVILSQTRNAWRPWERVKEFLLKVEDDTGEIPDPS